MSDKITLKAAADAHRCSVKTIRRLIGRGELTAYRKTGDRALYVDTAEAEAVFTFKPARGAA